MTGPRLPSLERAVALSLTLVTAALATGCVEPTTYRYTALIPAARPLAWDGRTAKDGSLRLEGSVSRAHVEENYFPREHDSALRVGATMVEGSAALAVTRGIELGMRFAYTDYAWSSRSATGTQPLPSTPSSTGMGPELRATIPLDSERSFTLGFAANVMSYKVPYAEWIKTGEGSPTGETTPCQPSRACVDGYRLFGERSESHLALSLGLYPSFAIGPKAKYGHAFLFVGGHTGYKNDGFTNRVQNGSTLESSGLVAILGGGYGIQIQPVRVSALLYKPLTGQGSPVNYFGGGMLTVGVDLELWESREDARERRQREEEERRQREAKQAPPPEEQ